MPQYNTPPDLSTQLSASKARTKKLEAAAAAPPKFYGTTGSLFPNPGALSGIETVLASIAVTIESPAGAKVKIRCGLSAFATASSSKINVNTQADSLGWGFTGSFFFNNASMHMWCGSFEIETGLMAPGAHTIYMGATVAAGGISMDANDLVYLVVEEI